MAAAWTMLFAKIAKVLTWVGQLWVAIFTAFWDLVRDAVTWPFEQAMKVAVSAANALDVSGISNSVGAWGSLPGDVLNILGLLGVGEAAAIIVAAITIRLTLQLIPFVRLGS